MNKPRFSPRRLFRSPLTLSLSIASAVLLLCPAVRGAVSVTAWGDNGALQCDVPPNLGDVLGIAGGGSHSLSLLSNRHVAAWGFNQFGQTDVPPDLTNAIAVAAGSLHSLALRANGTVAVWGAQPLAPLDLTNATAIAAGMDHSVAVRQDGTVVVWGNGAPAPDWLNNASTVAAGNGHSLALRIDSTVVAWGDNTFNKTNVPGGLTNVIAIAAGQEHSVALRRNGTVVAWGANTFRQCDVPLNLNGVVAISAGARHTLALKSNGTLVAWGDNSLNQTNSPIATNFIGIASGAFHNLALRGDGTPVFLLQPSSQTAYITKNFTFTALAVGAPPLNYQWRFYGTNLPGATNSSFSIVNVQPPVAGPYSVVVANSSGTIFSSDAILTVLGEPPLVVTPPRDQSTICGEGASFQVTADGSTPLFYQWLFNGNAIADASKRTLSLTNVPGTGAGLYSVVISNTYGMLTSAVATLNVIVSPPTITSPTNAFGKQGQPFTYQITGLHTPVLFSAAILPPGLSINPTNGIISGIPLENGLFGPVMIASNACTFDSRMLVLNFTSSIPSITSTNLVFGNEASPLTYTITASETAWPLTFSASNLPVGLSLDPVTGVISGSPVYGGEVDTTVSAANVWGVGSATLHFSLGFAPITAFTVSDLTTNYSSPYLLDFQFSLTIPDPNDPTISTPLIVDPRLLSATAFEDGRAISTNETGIIMGRATSKLFKTHLVLDFTESIASLYNGDTNFDGISDAVDALVAGARDFVDQQRSGSQVGLYEFHREDVAPQKVVGLTTDKVLLDNAIAGIWTNYVRGFPASSRAYDALLAAVSDLGVSNRDEQHYILFVSDGRDESSIATPGTIIPAALSAGVKIFCIGFGSELDPVPLQNITSQTGGTYYDAQALGGLTAAFDQVGKNLNGQYILRWATLKRAGAGFLPSFQISYQGLTADSPTNPSYMDTNNPVINTNVTPATTNYPLITNYTVIAPYRPATYTGIVTVGSLRLVPDAAGQPQSVTLRASYVPRYIRQLRLHYRSNWPTQPVLMSTNSGEILSGWSMNETNDGAGGKWLLLSSPNPQSLTSSIPFAAFGNLVTFYMRDMTNASNAFSLFAIDNSLYTNTGNQSFILETTNTLTTYTNLPFGTPVPWLIAHGFPNNFAAAELSDPDGDGIPTWQEYQANTDPRDPASRFLITSMLFRADGRYQVSFTSSPNRFYRVDLSMDLVNWQTLGDNIPGTGAEITFVDTSFFPDATKRYYRIAVH